MIVPFYPITDQYRESFCAMDIPKINLILEIDRKFCKVSKLEFVATLSRVFEYLKLLGENSFDCYSAKCSSDTCCNCGNDVLVFISQKLKYYIPLMVEGDNERIYQISECYNYNFKSSKIQTRILLKDFVAPNWQELVYDRNDEIVKELYPTDDYIPNFSEFSFWNEKTKWALNRNFSPVIKRLKLFYSTISPVDYIIEDVSCALESYEKLNLQNEATIIFWLAEYENIIDFIGDFSINIDLDSLDNYRYDINDDSQYFYDVSVYSKIPDFERKYHKHYNSVYKKFDLDKHFFRFQREPLLGRLKELGILVDSNDFTSSRIFYEVNHENLKTYNDNYLKE